VDAYNIILSILMPIVGVSTFYLSLGRGGIAKFFIEEATKNRMKSSFYKDCSYDEVEKGIKIFIKVVGIFLYCLEYYFGYRS